MLKSKRPDSLGGFLLSVVAPAADAVGYFLPPLRGYFENSF